MYPSTDFANFVQALETLFCAIFGDVMHMNDLLKTLCKNAEKEVTHLQKCGSLEGKKKRLHDTVKLYVTVGIHYAIKI